MTPCGKLRQNTLERYAFLLDFGTHYLCVELQHIDGVKKNDSWDVPSGQFIEGCLYPGAPLPFGRRSALGCVGSPFGTRFAVFCVFRRIELAPPFGLKTLNYTILSYKSVDVVWLSVK